MMIPFLNRVATAIQLLTITRSVIRGKYRNRDQLEKGVDDFAEEKSDRGCWLDPVVNSEQSGVQFELFTDRTLAPTSLKKVKIVASSVAATISL